MLEGVQGLVNASQLDQLKFLDLEILIDSLSYHV